MDKGVEPDSRIRFSLHVGSCNVCLCLEFHFALMERVSGQKTNLGKDAYTYFFFTSVERVPGQK